MPMDSPVKSFRDEARRAGITSSAIAAKLGLTQAEVEAIEKGAVPCSADLAGRYRRAVIELGGKFGIIYDGELS